MENIVEFSVQIRTKCRMKHILFVLDYYLPHRGGVENVFENVITRLLKKWYKVSVLTSHFDQKLPLVELHEHLTIYRTWSGRLSFLFCAIKTWISILKKHHDSAKDGAGISVIHASTYGWTIPGSILGMLFKKKVILTVHEVFGKLRKAYKWTFGWRLYRLFERSIFRFPYDVYHCVSRYTMNCLRIYYWIPDNKLKMIYNGVDYEFRNPEKVPKEQVMSLRKEYWREDKFVVLYYGHAGKSKGIDYLIEAVPWILALDEKIIVVFNLIESKRTALVKSSIEWRVTSNEINNRVQIFNWFEKEELRKLVASVDCVVAPSLSEGFGSVHTEVCAMKKPLITTDVASIPEVIWGNVKFVSPGNAEEIVKAVKEVESHKVEGRKSNEMIPQKIFPSWAGPRSWDETVNTIEKLYN